MPGVARRVLAHQARPHERPREGAGVAGCHRDALARCAFGDPGHPLALRGFRPLLKRPARGRRRLQNGPEKGETQDRFGGIGGEVLADQAAHRMAGQVSPLDSRRAQRIAHRRGQTLQPRPARPQRGAPGARQVRAQHAIAAEPVHQRREAVRIAAQPVHQHESGAGPATVLRHHSAEAQIRHRSARRSLSVFRDQDDRAGSLAVLQRPVGLGGFRQGEAPADLHRDDAPVDGLEQAVGARPEPFGR